MAGLAGCWLDGTQVLGAWPMVRNAVLPEPTARYRARDRYVCIALADGKTWTKKNTHSLTLYSVLNPSLQQAAAGSKQQRLNLTSAAERCRADGRRRTRLTGRQLWSSLKFDAERR